MIMAISTVLVGCQYDDDYTPPNYVTFEAEEINVPVDEDGSNSIDVKAYTADVTGSDRTFTINVAASSTINPDSYTVPGTITIPANSNETTFTIDFVDNSLSNEGDDVLVLELQEEQGLSAGAPLEINVAKICEFEPVGVFTNTSGWFEAKFPVELVAGAGANQYVVKDMFAEGTDITFTVNADYTVSVPKQNAWVSGTYGQASVTGRAGSYFNPCSRVVVLVLQHTVSAGSFGTFTEVLDYSPETDSDSTDGGDA